MRIAVLSDIHGNLEALRSVLEAIDTHGPDSILCLGDIVGYGADPGACVRELRGVGALCLAGNHDHAACGLLDSTGFNDMAKEAIDWTARQISRGDRAFLESLRLTWTSGFVTGVHATIVTPEQFDYVLEDGAAAELLAAQSTALCLFGHSHVPWVWQVGGEADVRSIPASGKLAVGERSLINVGSVGQPRDGDPNACFAITDTDARTVTLHRVAYDVAAAAEKIRRAGLPELLAARLFVGR